MLRMPEERENELVLQAQKGSTKAFTALEKQYHWLVFKVARDILEEAAGGAVHAEAEDVTQDVFEYAFVHIKDYKAGRFYRWLWSLAKVAAMRQRHKLWEHLRYTAEYDDEFCSIDAFQDVDLSAPDSWTQAVADLEKQIQLLPRRQREDLKSYSEGEKPRDIAKRTRRKVRAVYNNLDRAKRAARKCVNSAI